MRFEENVKIYEKGDKIEDILYGSRVELKLGDRNYITGTYQGMCNDGFAIIISSHTYYLSIIQEIKVNVIKEEIFELGNIVEIANIDGLNRVLHNKYPKGGKELIGLQGKISMIDTVTCKNVTYCLVDLPISKYFKLKKENRIEDDNRVIFLEENLKLVKEGENKVDNSRFFNPKDIKLLNYKDLDGKTLKMIVVDNDEYLLVTGVDKENNTIYILQSEIK